MLSFGKIKEYVFKLIVHSFFWVIIYFFYNYFLGFGSNQKTYIQLFSAFLMPITMTISYFVVYFLVPKYLLKKLYKSFILYTIYTLILSVYAIILSVLFALVYLADLNPENASPITKTLPFIILGVFFVVLIVVTLSLILHNYKSIVKNEDLKNKILQTQLQLKEQELKLLKMQIHPHFLFNSLNTIYGFALKKGEETPKMILKLSNLLDYILYQIEKPSVSLENEIYHLQDYISLEKLRFHDTLQVNLIKESAVENINIAPMMLIPFVENSFKHGAIVNGVLVINILIKKIDNTILFEVENSIIEKSKSEGGIGLENIQKRLKMLYPNAHTLEINENDQRFKVSLTLQLNGLKSIKNV
jgi:sensor histidine kinase YesM